MKLFQKKFRTGIIAVLSLVTVLSCFIALKPVLADEVVKPSDLINADAGVSGFDDNYSIGYAEGSIDYSGVFVKTNSSHSKISYKNVIDAKTLTKDDALIEIQFLGAGIQGYSKAKTAALYLTDADNPSNRIGVGFYPTNDLGEDKNGGETYFRVIYNGQSVSYDEQRERHWVNNFGLCAYGRSLYPGKFGEGAGKSPTLIRFDYEEKAFYLDTHDKTCAMILDLDLPLHVGEDALWEGFSLDRCILSFEIEYESSKNGGFIVGQLLGRNLKTDQLDLDANSPSVAVAAPKGSTVDALPKAEVGTPYALPRVDTFDFIYGTANVSVKAFRNDVEIASEIVNGNLVATQPSDVKLVYTATNSYGNTAVAEATIKVVQELAPFTYSKSNDTYPVFGEYFDVPSVTVTGGSGLLTVNEKVMYNGRVLDFVNSRKVLINEAGSITVSIEVQGYTGQKESYVFVYSISLDKANIIVNGMPFSVNTGKTLVIPDFEVIQQDGTEAGKKVYVGETDVTNTMSYNVTEPKGTILPVKFCGGTGDDYNEITYEVMVVSETYKLSDYVYVTEGDATIQDSYEDSGISFKASSDATARFAYPVSLYKLNVYFDFNGEATESLDIVFTGYENRSDTIFFRLSYLSNDSTALTINGKGEPIIVPVGFLRLSSYKLIFQNNTGEIYFANNLIGHFEPLQSSGVVVDFRLNGVAKQTEVLFTKLSNQSLNPNAYIVGDNVSAYVYIEGSIEKYKQVTAVGANLLIPSAKAYDVLSDSAKVTLVITSPSKQKIYSGDISKPYYLNASEYGIYIISYSVKDAKGNSTNFNYNIEMMDRINPVITVDEKPDEVYSVGDKFKPSKVVVSDNYDTNPVVEVFVKNNVTGSVVLVQNGAYEFKQAGKYTLVYKVRDAAYNYARVEYVIEVVE